MIDGRKKIKFYFDKSIKNKFIGSSRFYEYDKYNSYIKVGYTFLISEYWGTNTNYNLKVLMLNKAFKIVDNVQFDIGKKI